MEDHQRHGFPGRSRDVGELPQLVVDRVPVVVAVDDRCVHRRQARQHVEAQGAVEYVTLRPLSLVHGRVELRRRVDHVQFHVVVEIPEHQIGVLATERADLDDTFCSDAAEHGENGNFPEGEHWLQRMAIEDAA